MWVLIATDSEAIRYSGVSNARLCAARQMLGVPLDADVLLLGSSRIRRGFSAETVMDASGGAIASAYNLARPDRGILRDVVMLRDLLERGARPRMVVFEIPIDEFQSPPQDDPTALRLTNASFLRWSDIPQATDVWDVPGQPPLAVAGNLALNKLSLGLELALDGTVASVLTAPAGPIQRACLVPRFDKVDKQGERKKQKLLEEVLATNPNHFEAMDDRDVRFEGYEAAAQMRALAMVRSYAQKYGFKLVLTRLPGFTQQPHSARVKSAILEILPEYRFPPDPLYRLDETYFSDEHHVSPAGRQLMSRWLAELLVAETASQ